MFVRYRAFGLNIDSELPLWSSLDERQSGDADLRVYRGPGESAWPVSGFELGSDDAVLDVGSGIRMRVAGGQRIEWQAPPQVGVRELALLSAGAGLAMTLAQRSFIVIHGATLLSADGEAVCLAGASGAGKSSLAAAALRSGYRLVSDGMSVIRVTPSGAPLVLSGPRQMKLWPDAVTRFGLESERYERVVPERDKLMVPLDDGPHAMLEAPLTKIAIVKASPFVASSRLLGSAALTALIGVHFLGEYVTDKSSAELLRSAARLVDRVRLITLERGQAPQQIPEALSLLRA